MKTAQKGKLGCLLLGISFALFVVGTVLMLGSAHPMPGTPVRGFQFGTGIVLATIGMLSFPVAAFFALVAALEWLVDVRRRDPQSFTMQAEPGAPVVRPSVLPADEIPR